MPAANPRITTTLDPETIQVIEEIAAESNTSVSKVAAKYLRGSMKILRWWRAMDEQKKFDLMVKYRSKNPATLYDHFHNAGGAK